MALGRYERPVPLTPFTVNVTVPLFFRTIGRSTLQEPLAAVVQEDDPETGPLQAPLTVAPEIGAWAASCTAIDTVACQFLPRFALERSRSPTCIVPGTGVAVRVVVGAAVAVRVAVGIGVAVRVGVVVGGGGLVGVRVGVVVGGGLVGVGVGEGGVVAVRVGVGDAGLVGVGLAAGRIRYTVPRAMDTT